MWVHEEMRGLGIGLRILQELEAKAREFGLSPLRLETNQILKEAQGLVSTVRPPRSRAVQ